MQDITWIDANTLSTSLGYLSIFCWLNAQLPQMLENYRLQSADGLSLYLLYFWLAGDLGNMFSCVLNHQLPFQTYLAMYFVSTDLILLFQYFYYKHKTEQPTSDEEACLLVIHPIEQIKTMEDTISEDHGYGTLTQKKHTPLMAILLFGLNFHLSGSTSLKNDNVLPLGLMLAWMCTSFYLISRIPQIYKNYKRHSTQGLSLALFSFAVSGNVTYALSILAHPGHTQASLMQALPYLSGSLGTLFLDAIIFCQYLYYQKKNKLEAY
ncbi:PQ loop repeat-domain-containing protein [Choanephora cucurbitarum]|nr:PQ loop repeat-domain-containing protein [Choanephora cucurbitarum]